MPGELPAPPWARRSRSAAAAAALQENAPDRSPGGQLRHGKGECEDFLERFQVYENLAFLLTTSEALLARAAGGSAEMPGAAGSRHAAGVSGSAAGSGGGPTPRPSGGPFGAPPGGQQGSASAGGGAASAGAGRAALRASNLGPAPRAATNARQEGAAAAGVGSRPPHPPAVDDPHLTAARRMAALEAFARSHTGSQRLVGEAEARGFPLVGAAVLRVTVAANVLALHLATGEPASAPQGEGAAAGQQKQRGAAVAAGGGGRVVRQDGGAAGAASSAGKQGAATSSQAPPQQLVQNRGTGAPQAGGAGAAQVTVAAAPSGGGGGSEWRKRKCIGGQ